MRIDFSGEFNSAHHDGSNKTLHRCKKSLKKFKFIRVIALCFISNYTDIVDVLRYKTFLFYKVAHTLNIITIKMRDDRSHVRYSIYSTNKNTCICMEIISGYLSIMVHNPSD